MNRNQGTLAPPPTSPPPASAATRQESSPQIGGFKDFLRFFWDRIS